MGVKQKLAVYMIRYVFGNSFSEFLPYLEDDSETEELISDVGDLFAKSLSLGIGFPLLYTENHYKTLKKEKI